MKIRYYDDEAFDIILREVIDLGRSEGWCMNAGDEKLAGAIEVRLRSYDIGYVDDMLGRWCRAPGGSTMFWPAVDPPLDPAITRSRIERLADEDRCCEGCPTYGIGEVDGYIAAVACDACWHDVPKDERIFDHDVAALPEAQERCLATIVRECPDIFPPKLCVKCRGEIQDPELEGDERCESCADPS